MSWLLSLCDVSAFGLVFSISGSVLDAGGNCSFGCSLLTEPCSFGFDLMFVLNSKIDVVFVYSINWTSNARKCLSNSACCNVAISYCTFKNRIAIRVPSVPDAMCILFYFPDSVTAQAT